VISATIGEFDDARAFVRAAKRLRELHFSEIEAYMPHAIPELDASLGIARTKLRHWVLVAGLAGVVGAYLVQWLCNAIDYPIIVGARPFNSLPSDVPIMFESGILLSGTTAFVAMIVLSRMPRLWSPILDVPGYERTCVDRFWLVVRYPDPAWTRDLPRTLAELGAIDVRAVGDVP
jgi:hypothetical protein